MKAFICEALSWIIVPALTITPSIRDGNMASFIAGTSAALRFASAWRIGTGHRSPKTEQGCEAGCSGQHDSIFERPTALCGIIWSRGRLRGHSYCPYTFVAAFNASPHREDQSDAPVGANYRYTDPFVNDIMSTMPDTGCMPRNYRCGRHNIAALKANARVTIIGNGKEYPATPICVTERGNEIFVQAQSLHEPDTPVTTKEAAPYRTEGGKTPRTCNSGCALNKGHDLSCGIKPMPFPDGRRSLIGTVLKSCTRCHDAISHGGMNPWHTSAEDHVGTAQQ